MRPFFSDFFEVVNGFEEEPKDDYESQQVNDGVNCVHFDLILLL
jgi:hypothetical protein